MVDLHGHCLLSTLSNNWLPGVARKGTMSLKYPPTTVSLII